MMKKGLYYLLYGFLWLLSLLPLWVHYVIADVICVLVYHVVGYRKALVRRNLADSFPDKSAEELRAIEKAFYHWFCDYLVETVKLLTISRENLQRRMVFKGTELVNEMVESGQSCAVYLGHYCNWEWITSLPLWVSPKAQCGQIYHVLENQEFDQLFLRLRQRFGAVCIPMAETLRRLAVYRQQQKPVVIGYISDQVPFWNNIHHWLDFLHHDTPRTDRYRTTGAQHGACCVLYRYKSSSERLLRGRVQTHCQRSKANAGFCFDRRLFPSAGGFPSAIRN